MKVIGLHGKAGVGKDTLADILVRDHGFVKRGFADPLYEEVSAAFGVETAFLRNRSNKEVAQPSLAFMHCRDAGFADVMRGKCDAHAWYAANSPRRVLQLWGTEYRRAQNENYWLAKMGAFMWQHEHGQPVGVVIPDCRFENEARWVIVHGGGQVIEITRDVPDVAAHSSEKGLPRELISRTVDNNGPLSLLHDVAITAIEYY